MIRTLRRLVRDALIEDVGQEDITTTRTVPADARCEAVLVAKQDGVLSGIEVFRLVFDVMRAGVRDWDSLPNGARFKKGDEIASLKGATRAILTGERTAMNYIQHLTGVATLTAAFVEKVAGTGARIVDTRKTTPLMRQLEKAAVIHGGGTNHRHTLFNGVVIKDNHIVAAGGIRNAVAQAVAGSHHLMKIEVEVTSLKELDEAIEAGADVIMLDNMSLKDMRTAVERVNHSKVVLEASGNVNLERVRAIAETGVHVISAGALTHSAPAADLSLRIQNV